MAAVLIDSNILVDAHDRGEFAKQQQAIQLLEQLQAVGAGRLSVQSLAEFFSAVTKSAQPILNIGQAEKQAEELAHSWQVFDLTPQIVLEAIRGVRDHQFSYWNAQIWATARLNQIPLVLSEDFSDGTIVEGVRFVNPFTSTFSLHTVIA